MVVAEAQKQGGDCIWMDCETSFDPKFAEKLGVNTKKLILSQSTIGETTFDLIFKLLAGEPAVIVVDSVASMVPMKDAEEPMDQAVMATRARLMSRGLSVLNSKNKKTLIVFINQLRTDIGAYGGPQIPAGGRALGFYASMIVDIKRGDFIEKNKERIGHTIKFRVTKSKVSPPFKEGAFDFYYDGTINHISEIVTLALLAKKIDQSGAFYTFKDKKFHGREAIEEECKEHPEFIEELKKEIYG
jgi:recombination protein RecA